MAKDNKYNKCKECACKKCKCDDPTVNIQGKQVKWSDLDEAEQEAIRQIIKSVEKTERLRKRVELLIAIGMSLISIYFVLAIISIIIKMVNGE